MDIIGLFWRYVSRSRDSALFQFHEINPQLKKKEPAAPEMHNLYMIPGYLGPSGGQVGSGATRRHASGWEDGRTKSKEPTRQAPK
jgi:hypothetical protein